MRELWNRGKRKLAAFLALLLVINVVPRMDMKPVQAADPQRLTVNVKTDTSDPYEGASVSVSGNNGSTDAMGNCELQVENGDYEVEVSLKPEDTNRYRTVTSKQVTVSGSDEFVYFTLERNSFNVSITAGSNGTVSGGDAAVPYGDSVTLTATPDEGYCVSEVTSGGSSVLSQGNVDPGTGVWTYEISEVTSDMSFQASFAKKQYDVTIQVTTGDTTGEISAPVRVEHGAAIDFYFQAKLGHQLKGIKINNEDIAYSQVTLETDGRYKFQKNPVLEALLVQAVFEEIPVLSEAGLSYTIKEAGNALTAKEGVYYARNNASVIFNELAGKVFSKEENGSYGASIAITETTEISAVYTMDAAPVAFGTKEKYDLAANPIKVCIDNVAPQITLTAAQSELWINGDSTTVDIQGTVTDNFKVDRIVWSDTSITKSEALTVSSGNVMETAAGEFTIPNQAVNGSEVHYYLYAIDKAENCADPEEVVIYKDSTKPVITAADITTGNVKKLSFGNFFNGSITLSVWANDVNTTPASGVKKVNVYAGNTLITSKALGAGEASAGVGSKQFEIPVTWSDFATGALLRLTVEDAVGIASEVYELTDFGFSSTNVMLEMTKPSLAIQLPTAGRYEQTTGTETRYWYGYVPNIEYTASEEGGSGLYSGKVYQTVSGNGQVEMPEYAKDYGTTTAVYTDHGQLAADKLTGAYEGKNMVYLEFADLAGNTKEISQDYYLDRTAPEITGFVVEKADATVLQRVLNKLGFGTFANGMLTVTVSARDTLESSGLRNITLYLDSTAYATKAVDATGKAVFEIPAEDISDDVRKVYLDKRIYAKAADNVGNTSEVTQMTTANSNLADSRLMIENVMPDITVDLNQKDYVAENGIVYVKEKRDFLVSVADGDSGIGSVRILCNGTQLLAENYQAGTQVKNKSFTVHMADIAEPVDKIYRLQVVAVDNAGNEKVLEANEVCFDVYAPSVLNFTMEAEGSVEADGTVLAYEDTDYGYYFLTNTRVTVYAGDGEKDKSAGVKNISYYLMSADGTKGEVITAAADAEEKISFVVPAGFKGQIYACAADKLDNVAERYVTPAGLIAESAEMHGREEHIVISRPGTSAKDINGLDLYGSGIGVGVSIMDTFSGIRKVEWSIVSAQDSGRNSSGSVELDNAGGFVAGNDEGWSKTSTDRNLVTGMSRQFQIDNNSNSITLTVTMTDRAGNTSSQSTQFSIDTVAPVITLSFDNMTPDEEYSDTYGADRVATITVKERNFSSGAIVTNVTNEDGQAPQITGWSTSYNASNPDESISTTTIVFSQDGKYTLEVSGQDAAGHTGNKPDIYQFIVDKTLPQIAVTYDNDAVANGNYYSAQRTATISIEEHNFEEERVQIVGVANDDGQTVTFPAISGFTENGDIHTATIHFEEDANYSFEVNYSDRAGNQGEQYVSEAFFVDKTAPEIVISGVEDMSANNGEVIPVIALSDTNYDENGVSIILSGANRGILESEGSFSDQTNGQIFTFADFAREQQYDDIYTLEVSLKDKAGNESQDSIMFSVNRFGSVYVFDDSLKQILGTYVQKEQDIKLSEINVDNLEHDTIRVVVDVNGSPRDLVEGQDYTVVEKGGNGEWYQYDYTINAELFAGDGRYIVTLYSKDRADNINENVDETKKAEISFGVDKTPPVVVPIDIASEEQYAMDVKTATVTVNDNLVLQNVDIYVGEEKCEYIENGDSYTFDVPGATSRQDVTVAAVDAAGNRTNYVISGVLVTSNAFVRWYNNKPLFVGSLVGVATLSGGSVGLAGFLRRRKIRIK